MTTHSRSPDTKLDLHLFSCKAWRLCICLLRTRPMNWGWTWRTSTGRRPMPSTPPSLFPRGSRTEKKMDTDCLLVAFKMAEQVRKYPGEFSVPQLLLSFFKTLKLLTNLIQTPNSTKTLPVRAFTCIHRWLPEIQQRTEVQHVWPRPGWLTIFQMCGEARGRLLAPLMHQCQHQWRLHVGAEQCPQCPLARLQEGNVT